MRYRQHKESLNTLPPSGLVRGTVRTPQRTLSLDGSGAAPAAEPPQIHAPFDGAPIARSSRWTARARSGPWPRPTLFRDRDGWLSPARRIEILRRAAAML